MLTHVTDPKIRSILVSGDISGLLALRRSQFGEARMEGAGGQGGGGGAGGGAGAGAAAGQGAGGAGAGQGAPGAGGQGGGAQFDPIKSQDELDRIIGDRLARERAKLPDIDELQRKAAAHDAEQAKNQSDLDREKTAREAAEKDRDKANERANKTARDAAIITEAAKQGAKHPAHVPALITPDDVVVDKDGNVTGAEAAVKKLAEQYGDYFGTTTTTTRTAPPAHGLGPREGAPDAPGAAGRAMAERRFPKK